MNKNCIILYGQTRTLGTTIFSIKRLNEILNFDMYCIINLSDDDNKNEIEKNINEKLNPTLLEFINNNEFGESNNEIKCRNQNIKYFETTMISFDEYKKLPKKLTYYDINEIKKNGIKFEIKKNNINNISKFPYGIYVEDKLIYSIFKKIPKNKYDKVFLIRTDSAWFENYDDKKKYTYVKKNGFREKTALHSEYNEVLKFKNFKELKNKIINCKDNILGNYFYNGDLNLYIPNAHSRIFNFFDLEKYLTVFNNYENIIDIFNTYPILYHGWDGELYQKRIYEYLNLKFDESFYLNTYVSLIRENN